VLRQRSGLMTKLCGGPFPPVFHLDGNNPMEMAVFALPTFVPATEGKNGIGRFRSRLNLHIWTKPGVAKVRKHDGTVRHLWFCNCSPANVCIKRTADALWMMAGGCDDVSSAQCGCVAYCQSILDNGGCDVEEIIRISPKAPDASGMCVGEHIVFNDVCDGCCPPCTFN
jgi:hypothetical protein